MPQSELPPSVLCNAATRNSQTQALMFQCLPSLLRWTHGRIPRAARARLDSHDYVQEALLHILTRMDAFEPRSQAAMQAYLRKTVLNLIRDEARRLSRRPSAVELNDDIPSSTTSPLDLMIELDGYSRYQKALVSLRDKDRRLIVARTEQEADFTEIAREFGFSSIAAARMAFGRAFKRLVAASADEPRCAPIGRRIGTHRMTTMRSPRPEARLNELEA
jgi:RNA polymerase sigma factor (sigma-70 family)